MTTSILETINSLPSNAIKAALDGIKKQELRPDFIIHMSTFGQYNKREGLCYGCAATCAVQEIAGINLVGEKVYDRISRATALDFCHTELSEFEYAIDDARIGELEALGLFCKVDLSAEAQELRGFVKPLFEPASIRLGKEGSIKSLNKAYEILLAAGK